MTQAQKGICAEPNLHALYLIFNVIDDEEQAIRSKLAYILELFTHFDEEYYEAMKTAMRQFLPVIYLSKYVLIAWMFVTPWVWRFVSC